MKLDKKDFIIYAVTEIHRLKGQTHYEQVELA